MSALAAVLATLLPGDGDWPSGLSVVDAVAAGLGGDPALPAVLAALPADFAAGDEAALRVVEAAVPAAFERVVSAAYIAYYTAPAVRDVIARVSGYENRPPQPLGYELPEFDEGLLAVQKQRAPFWRDPDKELS